MAISIPHTSAVPHAGVPRRWRRALSLVGQGVAALLAAPFRLVEDRRLRRTIADMSARELSDIGLSRQDVSDATALPLWSAAGQFIAARAGEMRPRRRPPYGGPRSGC